MTEHVLKEDSERSYGRSWVDHLNDWVDRRPGPSWFYYLGLGLVLLMFQILVLWIEGAYPLGNLGIAQVYVAAALSYLLALIHYLDRRVIVALATMRPALKASDQEIRQMSYRLTNLPALATLLAGLAAITFVLLSEAIGEPYRLEALDSFTVSAGLLRIFYLLCWFVFGTSLYHTVHQLRVINHIYTKHTRIDLFNTKPLYAFSNLAALTAGSLALVSYGWLIVNPWIDQSDPLVFLPMLILLLFAVVTFIWPQLGIHRLQVAEKERLLDEANLRFKAGIDDLHQKMDDSQLETMTDLNMALASLEIELNILKSSPTWPWEPELLQLLVAALALPLGLWLIQLILQRTLGS